jgi:peptidoglycan/xylan/chitin deacetylase (PgdA/CDA1 family)
MRNPLRALLRILPHQIRLRWLERSRRICHGVILMFHEVHDDDGYLRELGTGCTVSFLESVMVHLRRESWDVVTLDEALWRLEYGDPSRRFAALTFDDGYRDTLTRALPVLERHAAPFTVYIPAAAPTRELHSWWLGLRALFQKRDEITIPAMDATFECRDSESKVIAHNRANQWVHEDYLRAGQLDDTFRAYDISLASLNGAYLMDENELRTLARHPLVAIGAHTTSHLALKTLEAVAVRQEMTDGRLYLEDLLDRPILDFAYPYGACGDREFMLAAAAGFRTAVTTQYGPVFPAHRMIPHQLPRVGVTGTGMKLQRFAESMRRLRNLSIDDDPYSEF